MTTNPVENQSQNYADNSKDLNFRELEKKWSEDRRRAVEAEKRAADAEKMVQELSKKNSVNDDDEDDGEPYVDHRRLEKKLAKFGEQSKQHTQSEIQREVQKALDEERRKNWLKTNGDFYDVMQHAEKFAKIDEELAETILSMPDGFERQKLVYKTIKALGLHKPVQEGKSEIQNRVDANKRGPYYQPSGVGTAPYASMSDFSPAGQKQAHDKMQELKNRLRLG